MKITGTHINYYFQCHCKLWLFANGMNMEHTSDLVYEGKLIHENSYPQRVEKYSEIEIEGIKIDFYDSVNKVVHEIKKSDSRELAHEWQLKFYMYILKQNGIGGVTGILEYPKLRKTEKIELTDSDLDQIEFIKTSIEEIITKEICPAKIEFKMCKNCSYLDFCWSGEE